MERGAWLSRSSGNDEGKFRETMAMACSFLQVEETYPDLEKALGAILTKVIFSSAHT